MTKKCGAITFVRFRNESDRFPFAFDRFCGNLDSNVSLAFRDLLLLLRRWKVIIASNDEYFEKLIFKLHRVDLYNVHAFKLKGVLSNMLIL